MYLGSVAFFKHLIVGVIFLLIIGLTVSTIVLALGNSEKSREIEKLNSDKNALQTLLHETDNTDNTTSDADINNANNVNNVNNTNNSENNPPCEQEINITPPAPDLDAEEEEEIEPTPEKPYIHLFPHLYSDFVPPETYMNDAGFVYLTFDDGPSTGVTDSILRYLNAHGAKATFFVIPTDSDRGKRFLNQMLDSGHEIGVHCMNHDYNVIYASVEAYLDDFNSAWNLIYEQTGYKPYLYRFPGGSINDFNREVRDDIIAEMARRGFVYFDWNVDSRDALGHNWTQMWTSVLADVAGLNRAVVLFHDFPGARNTVYVIEDIVKELLARGHTLSAITPETKPVQF